MHPGYLLTAAGGHPLIDLDFTVFVQLVLFTITGLLASRLLFRPYLRMRDERTAGIEGAREEAARMKAQADAQMSDYESRLGAARERATAERRKLRAEAAAHEREVMDKTRTEASQALSEAQVRIDDETTAARQQLAPRADEIALAVASKLLGREVSPS